MALVMLVRGFMNILHATFIRSCHFPGPNLLCQEGGEAKRGDEGSQKFMAIV